MLKALKPYLNIAHSNSKVVWLIIITSDCTFSHGMPFEVRLICVKDQRKKRYYTEESCLQALGELLVHVHGFALILYARLTQFSALFMVSLECEPWRDLHFTKLWYLIKTPSPSCSHSLFRLCACYGNIPSWWSLSWLAAWERVDPDVGQTVRIQWSYSRMQVAGVWVRGMGWSPCLSG